jgi:hypothetical protein
LDFYSLNEDVAEAAAAAYEGGDGDATALASSYLPSYPEGVRLRIIRKQDIHIFHRKVESSQGEEESLGNSDVF